MPANRGHARLRRRPRITRLNAEVASLKTSVEKSSRTSNVQLTRLGDRLDRVEHAQAEPAAKLAKLTDAVDRMEHRTPAATTSAPDVIGSGPASAIQRPPCDFQRIAARDDAGRRQPRGRASKPPVLDDCWFVKPAASTTAPR